eukprot:gene16232-22398_t
MEAAELEGAVGKSIQHLREALGQSQSLSLQALRLLRLLLSEQADSAQLFANELGSVSRAPTKIPTSTSKHDNPGVEEESGQTDSASFVAHLADRLQSGGGNLADVILKELHTSRSGSNLFLLENALMLLAKGHDSLEEKLCTVATERDSLRASFESSLVRTLVVVDRRTLSFMELIVRVLGAENEVLCNTLAFHLEREKQEEEEGGGRHWIGGGNDSVCNDGVHNKEQQHDVVAKEGGSSSHLAGAEDEALSNTLAFLLERERQEGEEGGGRHWIGGGSDSVCYDVVHRKEQQHEVVDEEGGSSSHLKGAEDGIPHGEGLPPTEMHNSLSPLHDAQHSKEQQHEMVEAGGYSSLLVVPGAEAHQMRNSPSPLHDAQHSKEQQHAMGEAAVSWEAPGLKHTIVLSTTPLHFEWKRTYLVPASAQTLFLKAAKLVVIPPKLLVQGTSIPFPGMGQAQTSGSHQASEQAYHQATQQASQQACQGTADSLHTARACGTAPHVGPCEHTRMLNPLQPSASHPAFHQASQQACQAAADSLHTARACGTAPPAGPFEHTRTLKPSQPSRYHQASHQASQQACQAAADLLHTGQPQGDYPLQDTAHPWHKPPSYDASTRCQDTHSSNAKSHTTPSHTQHNAKPHTPKDSQAWDADRCLHESPMHAPASLLQAFQPSQDSPAHDGGCYLPASPQHGPVSLLQDFQPLQESPAHDGGGYLPAFPHHASAPLLQDSQPLQDSPAHGGDRCLHASPVHAPDSLLKAFDRSLDSPAHGEDRSFHQSLQYTFRLSPLQAVHLARGSPANCWQTCTYGSPVHEPVSLHQAFQLLETSPTHGGGLPLHQPTAHKSRLSPLQAVHLSQASPENCCQTYTYGSPVHDPVSLLQAFQLSQDSPAHCGDRYPHASPEYAPDSLVQASQLSAHSPTHGGGLSLHQPSLHSSPLSPPQAVHLTQGCPENCYQASMYESPDGKTLQDSFWERKQHGSTAAYRLESELIRENITEENWLHLDPGVGAPLEIQPSATASQASSMSQQGKLPPTRPGQVQPTQPPDATLGQLHQSFPSQLHPIQPGQIPHTQPEQLLTSQAGQMRHTSTVPQLQPTTYCLLTATGAGLSREREEYTSLLPQEPFVRKSTLHQVGNRLQGTTHVSLSPSLAHQGPPVAHHASSTSQAGDNSCKHSFSASSPLNKFRTTPQSPTKSTAQQEGSHMSHTTTLLDGAGGAGGVIVTRCKQ